MKTLYLCGAGNVEGVRLAVVINEATKRWDRIAILDDDAAKHGRTILGLEIAGPFSFLNQVDAQTAEVVNLVTRTTRKRNSARRKIEQYGLSFVSLIHPGVDMMGVTFEDDITVYQNVSFCAGAHVECGCVILTGAVVGHGCHMAQGCVVAPGAVINARVDFGKGVYLGTNASILPDLKLGAWATVGANSAVVQNVPEGATVMGVPAQVLMSGANPEEGGMTQATAETGSAWTERSKPLNLRLGSTESPSTALAKLRQAQLRFIESRRGN